MPIRGFYPIFSKAEHLFDASVSYSYDPGAMTWIKRDYPDAKVILVVRDQISVFESMVNYYNIRLWRKGPKELEIFENPEIYRRISARKLCRAIEITNQCQSSSTVTMRSQEIRDLLGDDAPIASRFVHMLYDQWVGLHHGVFGASNVLVHDFAELTENPARVVASTTEFLGLPELPAESNTEIPHLNRNASRKVFRLNAESRHAIRDVFLPHNEKLRAMTGVDLNRHLDESTG
jgi:hypothetical protein